MTVLTIIQLEKNVQKLQRRVQELRAAADIIASVEAQIYYGLMVLPYLLTG